MKHCSKCDTTMPLDDFYNNRSSKSGKSDYCKTCTKAYVREQSVKHRDRIAAYEDANREHRRAHARAKYAENAEAGRERARKWREAHPEQVREQNRRWSTENPGRDRERQSKRRARQRDLSSYVVTDKDLRRLLGAACAVTGCTNTDIQIDHIVPVARGGSHGVGNLQPLCSAHNQSKGARLWIEFRVYLARIQRAAA